MVTNVEQPLWFLCANVKGSYFRTRISSSRNCLERFRKLLYLSRNIWETWIRIGRKMLEVCNTITTVNSNKFWITTLLLQPYIRTIRFGSGKLDHVYHNVRYIYKKGIFVLTNQLRWSRILLLKAWMKKKHLSTDFKQHLDWKNCLIRQYVSAWSAKYKHIYTFTSASFSRGNPSARLQVMTKKTKHFIFLQKYIPKIRRLAVAHGELYHICAYREFANIL